MPAHLTDLPPLNSLAAAPAATPARPGRAPSALQAVIQRWPLAAFFVLAFALAWPYLIVDALGSHGRLPFRLPIIGLVLMGYGPSFAALIVTGATRGRAGLRALLGQLLVWRVNWRWYALAVFGIAGLFYLAYRLPALFGGPLPAGPALPVPLFVAVPLLFVVSILVNGEELGWRGFALPRLQSQHSALTASLGLGLVWGLFHLPLFFTVGSTQAGEPLLGFCLSTVASSVLMTWLYNNTRGSVWLSILFHAAVNTWSQIIPGIDTAHYPVGPIYWLTIALLVLAAAGVVAVFGPNAAGAPLSAGQKTD